uniref:Histone-lysine N-methyltransferase, H3 lysine-79 specific n=1 Tax=Steinernema glaseri TaxID=37863 RepID=A0A1I8AQF0_9BILA
MKRGSSVKASRSPKLAKKPRSASPPEAMHQLKLNSCAGGEPLIFDFSDADQAHVGHEILEIVRLAKLQFRELYQVLQPVSDPDVNKLEDLQLLCHKFNKAAATISSLWKGATKPGDEKFADEKFLKQICARAYNRAVTDVSALNKHYEAFSSETYGETSFERLQMIIEEVAPGEDDVFVDLGSGVGQLIVQMAGGSRVKKAVGIEISQLPNKFAKQLEVEFSRLMKWYGKKYRPFVMEHGDFLAPKYRQLITEEATIIFINNFAFTAELDTRIKRELLSELKDGTRIITTKPYALPGRTTNGRHMNDISMILDVKEMRRCDNACSWTSNYVAYYQHTINHSRIELYYQNQRNPQSRALSSENSRRSSVRSSRESSVMSSSNSGRQAPGGDGDDDPSGATTRRKWGEQTGEEPKKPKEKAKKAKKAIPRGRPRKSAPMSSCNAGHTQQLGGSRLSSDAIDGGSSLNPQISRVLKSSTSRFEAKILAQFKASKSTALLSPPQRTVSQKPTVVR